MDPKETAKQLLEFNKRIFDNTFNTMSSLQDETESFFTRFMDKANWITPEGKIILSKMSESYKTGRRDIKTMADDNYRKASEYFVPSGKKQ